jgi:hypothetical protein
MAAVRSYFFVPCAVAVTRLSKTFNWRSTPASVPHRFVLLRRIVFLLAGFGVFSFPEALFVSAKYDKGFEQQILKLCPVQRAKRQPQISR